MEKGRRCKSRPVKKLPKKKSDLLACSKEEEYNKLKAKEELLDKEIAELEKQGVDTNLKPQMEALHEYNETKDITQMVLGYIADVEHTTIAELHKLYNLPTD